MPRRTNDIMQALCRIRDIETMRRFAREILTPAERKDLALRWKVMRLLEAGVPQREIAERLGVSLCKITRGSRVLKKKECVSRRLLQTED
jgi:TrpR family transcriptional regulator, trp operon repressor